MIALPQYIDREAWEAWMEVRKQLKAPNTDYALKLLVYEVQRIKDAGHDPNAAIKQSVLKGWKDVYPSKEKAIEAAPQSQADKTAEMLRQREEQGYTAPPPELRLIANKIRSKAA